MAAGPIQPTIYQAPDEDVPVSGRGEVGGYVSGSMMNMNGAAPGGTSSQAVSLGWKRLFCYISCLTTAFCFQMNIEQKDYYPTDTRAVGRSGV